MKCNCEYTSTKLVWCDFQKDECDDRPGHYHRLHGESCPVQKSGAIYDPGNVLNRSSKKDEMIWPRVMRKKEDLIKENEQQ